ncbi:MAG: DUF1667 domain-containing protein [Clostridiales bacterium]|nr:DUF1667 domain-containing protein [Clostridiales bacterium]
MLKEFTCIVCPNGCGIEVETEDGKAVTIRGAGCRRGEDYARQEISDPRRTIASSVRLKNGELPLVSVRLDAPVPRGRIFDVMKEIREIELEAPVSIGDLVIENVLGLGANVIVTKNVGVRR